jgi:hypothetical protein
MKLFAKENTMEMVRKHAIAMVVVVVAVAAAFVAFHESPRSIAQTSVKHKWEYMSFQLVSDADHRMTWTLQTTGARKEFKTIGELAQHIGVKGECLGQVSLLCTLGAEGWELVSVDDQSLYAVQNGGWYQERWTLKRPAE